MQSYPDQILEDCVFYDLNFIVPFCRHYLVLSVYYYIQLQTPAGLRHTHYIAPLLYESTVGMYPLYSPLALFKYGKCYVWADGYGIRVLMQKHFLSLGLSHIFLFSCVLVLKAFSDPCKHASLHLRGLASVACSNVCQIRGPLTHFQPQASFTFLGASSYLQCPTQGPVAMGPFYLNGRQYGGQIQSRIHSVGELHLGVLIFL